MRKASSLKNLLLLCFFIFSIGDLYAQDKSDSLKLVFQNSTNQEDQLEALRSLCKIYFYKDSDIAKKYALAYDSIAQILNDSSKIVRGKILQGNAHFVADEQDLALNLFLDGLRIAERRNDLLSQASLNTSLSAVSWSQRDTVSTQRFSKKALDLYKAIKDTNRIAIGNTNLGLLYLALEKYDSAAIYYNEGIKYYTFKGNINATGVPLMGLAKIELIKKNSEMSLNLVNQAIAVIDRDRRLTNLLEAYFMKADALSALKRFGEVGALLKEGDELIANNNLKKEERTILNYWAAYYEDIGDYKKALTAIRLFYEKEQEMFTAEKNKNLNELLTKYETEKKEAEISRLALSDQLKASRISLQRFALVGMSIGLIVLGFLVYRIFSQKKKIEKQNETISKTLAEKDTLLREIHHRVKNNLQLVSSLLSLQSRHVDDPNALEVLKSGKARIRSMALIHQDLYNRENLMGVSIKDYLEKLCTELIESYQIDTNQIKLNTNISDLQLDVDTLVPLGLIINELLTNALKHAFPDDRTGQIDVSLQETEGQLQLKVSDNGVGMDEDKKSENSFGFKLINTLLYQLQGELKQESLNGTHLFLIFNNYKIAA